MVMLSMACGDEDKSEPTRAQVGEFLLAGCCSTTQSRCQKQFLVTVEKLTSNFVDSDGRFRVVQREGCVESCESGRLKEEEGRGV